MTETIPTPQTPSYHEYAIVATFSQTSIAKLSAVQAQLGKLLGDAIWLTPQRALHSTLMEIICNTDYGDEPREQLFSEWHKQYGEIVTETIAKLPPVEITFNELEVSPRAIIVKASNAAPFNELRSALLTNLQLPCGTKMPPDITH